jgi:hypothetical protein
MNNKLETMNSIDSLMIDAQVFLDEINLILNALLQAEDDTDNGGSSDDDKILSIQLTLQYRLSCEDALSYLLKLDHNLLYSLGIQPQQSAKINMDRLAYALGNDDLKQILNVLAILTGSLSKILTRHKNQHASFSLNKRKPQKQQLIAKELSRILTKQKQFMDLLYKLDPEIEQLLKLQAGEPVYDYIAALRGPISHFHEAIIHGLDQAEQLYHHLNKTPLVDYQLNTLIKEAEHVLQLLPSTFNSYSNHPIKQFEHPKTTSEQLEQRAAAKRLRPFFGSTQ